MSEDTILKQTGLLKSDYLTEIFFKYGDWHFWVWWVLPFLFTYFSIWMLPKYVLLPAFIKEQDYEFKKKKYEIEKQKGLVDETTKLEMAEIEKLDTVVEKIEKEKEIKTKKDPKEEWDQEVSDFKRIGYSSRFLNFLNKLYSGYRTSSSHDTESIAYFDSLGLIKVDRNGMIEELTEKGKYFTRKIKSGN